MSFGHIFEVELPTNMAGVLYHKAEFKMKITNGVLYTFNFFKDNIAFNYLISYMSHKQTQAEASKGLVSTTSGSWFKP